MKYAILILSLWLGLLNSQAHAGNKVLVVLSSSNKITLKDGTIHPTGYFLSELGNPLKALIDAGFEPVFATPHGDFPALDSKSDDAKWFGGNEDEHQKIKSLVNQWLAIQRPLSLHQILNGNMPEFAGLFVPGGHAPMEDLANNSDMGRLLVRFHSAQIPTALICHGPAALLSAQNVDGSWPYSGYRMTSFSTAEEQQEEPGQDNALGGFVKFYLDQALRDAGADISIADKWQSHVVKDRELITGQNPFSEPNFSRAFVQALLASPSATINMVPNDYKTDSFTPNQAQSEWVDQINRTAKNYGESLQQYFIAVLPKSKPSFVPDVMTLLVTNAGGEALAPVPSQLIPGKSYDVLGRSLNWREGVTTFFIGLRRTNIEPDRFLSRLHAHIKTVANSLGAFGLRGYIVMVNENYEVAFMNWESEEAKNAAFMSPVGKAVAADGAEFLETLQWTSAQPFDGQSTAPGEFYKFL